MSQTPEVTKTEFVNAVKLLLSYSNSDDNVLQEISKSAKE